MKKIIRKIFKSVLPRKHYLGSIPKRHEEQELYFRSLYIDKGIYHVVQAIIINMAGSRSLLKARIFLSVANYIKLLPNVRLDDLYLLAHLAIASDKSEEIRRGYAWLSLQSEYYNKALEQALIAKQVGDNNPSWNRIYSIALEKINNSSPSQVSIEGVSEQDLSSYKWLEVIKLPKSQDKRIAIFSEILEVNGIGGLKFYIENQKGSLRFLAGLYILAAKQMALSKDIQATKILLNEAFNKEISEPTLRGLYWIYKRIGDKSGCEKVLLKFKELLENENDEEILKTQAKLTKDFNDSFNLADIIQIIPSNVTEKDYKPIAGKVSYIIHNSLPYSSGGYATRTHGLFIGLLEENVDIHAITRPGYPLDIVKRLKENTINSIDKIDKGLYYRVNYPLRSDNTQKDYLLQAADSVTHKLKTLRPSIVIAASNYTTAFPALLAAKRLGIPFIYEVRGFWEITRLSREPEFEYHADFEIQKKLESEVAKRADHVFTLTNGMRRELIKRGVSEDKITIIPNSCDPNNFIVREKNKDLLKKLDIPKDVPVIGYIGTLISYEGLDDLVKACGLLKKKGYQFRLLIVGNENASGMEKGSITKEIQEIAHLNGFAEWLIMPGRIPYDQVDSYYSLIDIAPFPRKPWPVCEIVSPMKPLEALATGKAILVSSVEALQDIVVDKKTGLIFEKGDINDLTQKIEILLKDEDLRATFGKNGQEWVTKERTWSIAARKMKSVIDDFF